MLMVNGLGQNHLKWLQVRKFSKDHVYFVDLWITFIHSWGGLEFQLKICVEERKEKSDGMRGKNEDFSLWLHFHQHSRKKKSKYNIYFPKSFRQWKKQIFLVVENFNGHNCIKKSKFFLAKSESKGSELSGVVNLLEVDI